MTAYIITVNGKTYDVEVEKKNTMSAVKKAHPSPVQMTQAVAPAPVPAAPVSPVVSGSGSAITAPMPGKIVNVKVSAGESVKKGQELIIMEAMKMNNPVLAVNDGIVKEIYVKPGDPVQTGASLISIG